MSKLVIVESPTKVKKIQQFLPKGYVVDSCVGHVRDLPSSKSEIPEAIKDKPWAEFAVDLDHDFQPVYVIIRGKNKVIQQLKKKLKDADELFLATDEDREGESIGWHLIEALKPKVPVKRMVFHEITKKAVLEALEHPRELDMDLVQAQETRRILDRLYGYALSPLLWKKVGGNLSAGRVQSVAVRLVVGRERERRAFHTAAYWDAVAHLDHGGAFDARLVRVDGKRVATGRDFDSTTGDLAAGADVAWLDEAAAKQLVETLGSAAWRIEEVDAKPRTSRPRPPFITSTLQQEANNRLNLGAKEAMRTAQRLYENGYITYMRTDSTNLSEEAKQGARAAILADWGEEYAQARDWAKKTKGAQEAHEAIRPAGESFQHPDHVDLDGKELALYRLIWQRTLASQMADERYTQTTVTAQAEAGGRTAAFTASGKRVDFPGYRAVWPAGRGDEPELPSLAVGDVPDCHGVEAEGHETKPPARYTEASLVQALEKEGIGRPSTYASILSTIQDRGYVLPRGKALVPSFTAFAVAGLMEKHFPRLVDTSFTADMEAALDEIASGDADWVPFLRAFFLGPDGLQAAIEERMASMDPAEARVIDLGDDLPFTVKIGRFGPYVEAEVDGETITATLPESLTPDELDEATVQRLLKAKAEGPSSIGELDGDPIYVMEGRYGPYYQLGEGTKGKKPKRASLPKGKGVADADVEEARFLLSLPRLLGEHPEGGQVTANVGRYGPYVAHENAAGDREFRSLKDLDHLKQVDLDEALGILAQPKARGRRSQTVLKELGPHPKDGKPVRLLEGRYGPYVKHEKTNASLPKGADPEALDIEGAVELLAAKKKGKK